LSSSSTTERINIRSTLARALSIEDVNDVDRTTWQAKRLRTVTPHRLFLAVVSTLAGAINVEGAVRLATAIDTRAPVDTWWLSPTVRPSYSTIGTTTYVWASRIVWGDRVICGDRVVCGDRVTWGDISQTLIASGMLQ